MLIETSENLTGRPRFWLSVVAISDWIRGVSTTRGTAMRATTNKSTTTPTPISSQVRSPLIAPCGSAPCSSALLDRRQPKAARPDRPRERPVLLERLRLSVRAIDDGTGGVVHDPVEIGDGGRDFHGRAVRGAAGRSAGVGRLRALGTAAHEPDQQRDATADEQQVEQADTSEPVAESTEEKPAQQAPEHESAERTHEAAERAWPRGHG